MSELALIIEDDEDLASIFAEALRGVGFEVEHVADGKAAQERLKVAARPFWSCWICTCRMSLANNF